MTLAAAPALTDLSLPKITVIVPYSARALRQD
jgi:hypothetical protein